MKIANVGIVMLVGAAIVFALGCAPTIIGYNTLASHTVQVSTEQQADVVWLLKTQSEGGQVKQTVLRCTNSPQGPVCPAVSAGQ